MFHEFANYCSGWYFTHLEIFNSIPYVQSSLQPRMRTFARISHDNAIGIEVPFLIALLLN